MKKVLILILLLFVSSYSKTLMIAAAANTQFAIKEISKEFKKENPSTNIKLIISSSGKLTSQILKGAPFDVFISADTKYPMFLYKKGLTIGKPKIYAYGVLVLWSMKDIDLKTIFDITKPVIKKIAVPNPKTAPYGEQAVKVMKHYKVYEKVKNKLVYGESVAQASQYIVKKLVDVGFTAKSIVMAPLFKYKGKWIEIDQNAYSPIAQSAVLLKDKKDARQFFNFLFSKKAKKILKKYGYKVP